MKKLSYLFVMIAGMTLAAVNVNAQDSKSAAAAVKKDATSACCKSKTVASAGECDKKETASACTQKDASLVSLKVNGKTGVCKTKIETVAAQVKGVKSAKFDVDTQLLSLDLDNGAKLADVEKAVTSAGFEAKKM